MEAEDGARAAECLATISLRDEKSAPDTDPAKVNAENIRNLYAIKCRAALAQLPIVLPTVWEYCQKHVAAGRNWLECYPLKLLELWDILQQYRPRSILELGSGCTTAVFAEYIKGDWEKSFWSVDESGAFQQDVFDDLDCKCTRLICRAHKSEKTEPPFCFYEGVVSLMQGTSIDLLYVDGPASEAAAIDARKLCSAGNYPKTVMFDIRRTSVEDMRQSHEDAYHWDLSCRHNNDTPWYLSTLRHHTVARRVG